MPTALLRRGFFTSEKERSMSPRALRGLALLLCLLTGVVQAAESRPRIGLVLSGGGARGAAHIGVLEVLEQARVPVDCVAGTSMGALVAGAWAAGMSPAAMREKATMACTSAGACTSKP